MGKIKLKKGLSLPVNGEPSQTVSAGNSVTRVALVGDEYVGLKPTMEVEVGDTVKAGQVLFTDKKLPMVKYTAPGSGKVVEVNRGEKRVFKSLVIELSGNEEVTFDSYNGKELASLGKEKVTELLLNSGQWTAIRQRPFSKVANPEETPKAVFVSAMDTNPLAADMQVVLAGNEENFKNGLDVLSNLTEGNLYVCKAPGSNIPVSASGKIKVEEFEGPHPAGNVGTHIHFLAPAGRNHTVWYVTPQDVVAIGILFTTGKLSFERVVALGGAMVKNPRLLKTRLGADMAELVKGELKEGESRVIAGSILSGYHAVNELGFVGRFTQQISVIAEDREQKFLGWLSPGSDLYSVKNIVLSKLMPGKKLDLSTSTNGGMRPIVPSGSMEAVMPMDIIPTYLVRALAVKDLEEAEKLGALELDEEDLAVCTFVCPSKLDYGPMLRENLTIIEKEG